MLYHFLANVSDFGYSLEPDQTDNLNFVTIWHSGGILDYVLNWVNFKKHAKLPSMQRLNWIRSTPFLTWWTLWFNVILCQWLVVKFSYGLFEVIRLFQGMWKHPQPYMWWFVVLMKYHAHNCGVNYFLEWIYICKRTSRFKSNIWSIFL